MVFTSQGTVLVLKTQEGHITKMDKVSGSEASFLLGIEVGDMQLTRKQADSLQWQEPEGRWNWDGMGRLWRAESGRPPKGGGIWTETWMMKRSQVNSWWESLAGKGKREEQVQRPWSLKKGHEFAEQQKGQCVWSSVNNGERLGRQEQDR